MPVLGMGEARHFHTLTLLDNGKVLVAAGFHNAAGGYNYNLVSSAELYDPATNAWSWVDSLVTPRYRHTATRLGNGSVLMAGGTGPSDDVVPGEPTSSAELYTP